MTIPVIPPRPRAQTADEYQKERNAAAMKIVAERMDKILHPPEGGNSGTAETHYDILGKR